METHTPLIGYVSAEAAQKDYEMPIASNIRIMHRECLQNMKWVMRIIWLPTIDRLHTYYIIPRVLTEISSTMGRHRRFEVAWAAIQTIQKYYRKRASSELRSEVGSCIWQRNKRA